MGGGEGEGMAGVNGSTLAQPVSFRNPGRRCRTCQLFYVENFGNLISIVNTHSVFSQKLTHILVTVPCQIQQFE